MAERTAFLTANNKKNVGQFAAELNNAGYEIVSLGHTAQAIENRGIPVTESVELAARAGCDLESIAAAPERTRRGIVAGYLSQMMEMNREELNDLGWPVIDLAYINLMPPSQVEPLAPGGLRWMKADASGVQMLSSAVIGQRTVLVNPQQLPEYSRMMASEAGKHEDPQRIRQLSLEALNELREYHALAENLGHIAMQQPV